MKHKYWLEAVLLCGVMQSAPAQSILKNKDEKEILSRQETADLLGTSLTTLFHWGNLGILNPTKIGRRVYYTQSELQRYFANVKPLNQ